MTSPSFTRRGRRSLLFSRVRLPRLSGKPVRLTNVITPRDSDVDVSDVRGATDAILMTYRNAEPLPESVYHYTSLEAAIKIIPSREVWASNVAYSNDPTEGEYGHQLIIDVLKTDAHFALQGLLQVVNHIDCYATSFSADPDLLTQWRAYCRNGRGVALGVAADVLAQSNSMIFMRVEYDRPKQEKLVRDVLNVFRQPILATSHNSPQQQALLQTLAQYFVIIRAILKSPAYFSEREYRLFNTLPKPWPSHQTQLLYRASESSVIPFYKVDLTNSRSLVAATPFTEIWVGPCLEFPLTSASLGLVAAQAHFSLPFNAAKVRMRCY